MPTVFSLFTTTLHCLLALGLNAAVNWSLHTDGYVAFTMYFVLLVHSHYKAWEKLSQVMIQSLKENNSEKPL